MAYTVPEGQKQVAVMCILQHADQYLLLQRSKDPNKGMYTPVGGKLNPYETPLAAARRETFEETGIDVPQWQYFGSLVETSPTKYNWHCYVYLAHIQWQAAPPCNEGTLHWVHSNDLLQVPTPKTDWHIYQYITMQKTFAFSAVYNEHLQLLNMHEEIENKLMPQTLTK